MREEWRIHHKLENGNLEKKRKKRYNTTKTYTHRGRSKHPGAQKRKKKKEKEEAIERARAELERLKLGPTKLWTGLVLHHKDVFVSHVLVEIE